MVHIIYLLFYDYLFSLTSVFFILVPISVLASHAHAPSIAGIGAHTHIQNRRCLLAQPAPIDVYYSYIRISIFNCNKTRRSYITAPP